MKPKILIPFVVILALLGGLVYLRESRDERPSITIQAGLENLSPSGLQADDITRIELYAGATPDEQVALEKQDDQWRVASRFDAPVNEASLEEYLEKLVNLKGEVRAQARTDESLEPYNLQDEQAFHVRVYEDASSDVAMHILVGKAPDTRSVFMREAGGDRVYVEAVNLRREAGVFGEDLATAPTADKWLDKEIVAVDEGQVNRIALRTPDRSIVLEKEAEAAEAPTLEGEASDALPATTEYRWAAAEGGFDAPLKETGVTNLINRLSSYTAADVVDPAQAEALGFDNPAYQATIDVGSEDAIVLEAVKADDGSGNAYIRHAGDTTLYEVNSVTFEQLFPKGSALYDFPSLNLAQDEISRIEVSQPEGSIVLTRENEQWSVLEPRAELETQNAALNTLATTLASWQATDYADADKAAGGFERSVSFTAGAQTHVIRVGAENGAGDGYYADLDESGNVFVMSETDFQQVFLTPRDLFVLTVLDVNSDSVAQIEIDHGGTRFAVRADDAGWTLLRGDEELPANDEAVQDFLAMLASYQVQDIRFGQTAPAWAPSLLATLRFKEGGSQIVNIGPAEGAQHPFHVGGQAQVYLISSSEAAQFFSHAEAMNTPIENETAADASDPAGDGDTADEPAESAAESEAAEAVETVVEEAGEAAETAIETFSPDAAVEINVEDGAPAEEAP